MDEHPPLRPQSNASTSAKAPVPESARLTIVIAEDTDKNNSALIPDSSSTGQLVSPFKLVSSAALNRSLLMPKKDHSIVSGERNENVAPSNETDQAQQNCPRIENSEETAITPLVWAGK